MKKRAELTCLLDFMEENIDLDHISKIEQLHYDSITYKEIDRLPLTVYAKPDKFERWAAADAYEDAEKMLFNEILWNTASSAYSSVRIKDDGPLMISADYGNGIIASTFGCKVVWNHNQMICTEPLGLDEIKKVISKGIPDIKLALGKRIIELYQYYHDRLKSYPKCYKALHITQPELLSPYEIFKRILGSDAQLCIEKYPELTKDIIKVIAHACVQLIRELEPILTNRINDAVFVHGCCCGGGILVKQDLNSSMLSQQAFVDYQVKPSLFMLHAFKKQGGGSLWITGQTNDEGLGITVNDQVKSIILQEFDETFIIENYLRMKRRETAIVGWGNGQAYETIRRAIKSGNNGCPILSGMSLMCAADDWEQGTEIVKNHQMLSLVDRNNLV